MRETLYSQKLYKAIRKLNMDKEETGQLLNCLYINGCSSEDCARLFGTTEDQVIKFLESEKLYGYQVCIKCGRLKDKEKGFKQRKNQRIMCCKECKKEYDTKRQKIHYEINKDIIKKQQKIYYNNNKGKISKRSKKYNKKNKEKMKGHHKIYYQDNKEEIRKSQKEYYKNNKEERTKHIQEYQNSEADIELVQKLDMFEEVLGNQIRCKYCGRWMIPTMISLQKITRS